MKPIFWCTSAKDYSKDYFSFTKVVTDRLTTTPNLQAKSFKTETFENKLSLGLNAK